MYELTDSGSLSSSYEPHGSQTIAAKYYLETLADSFELSKPTAVLSCRANSNCMGLLPCTTSTDQSDQQPDHCRSIRVPTAKTGWQVQLSTIEKYLLQHLLKAPATCKSVPAIGISQGNSNKEFVERFGSHFYAQFQRQRMEFETVHPQQHYATKAATVTSYHNSSDFKADLHKQFGLLPIEARNPLNLNHSVII